MSCSSKGKQKLNPGVEGCPHLLWPTAEPDDVHVCPFSSGRGLPDLTVYRPRISHPSFHEVSAIPRLRLHVKVSTTFASVFRLFGSSHSCLYLSVHCHLQDQWWQVLPLPQPHRCLFLIPNHLERNSKKTQAKLRHNPLKTPGTEKLTADSPGRNRLCLTLTCLEQCTPATLRTALTPCFSAPPWPPHSLCSGFSLQHTQHYRTEVCPPEPPLNKGPAPPDTFSVVVFCHWPSSRCTFCPGHLSPSPWNRIVLRTRTWSAPHLMTSRPGEVGLEPLSC